jgi:hypothetical protein
MRARTVSTGSPTALKLRRRLWHHPLEQFHLDAEPPQRPYDGGPGVGEHRVVDAGDHQRDP